jgi:hypothetical protein
VSADSYDSSTSRESYELKAEHQKGTYIVLVVVYDAPAGRKAYPRLEIRRPDTAGGTRTILRGRVVSRAIQEVPMDESAPLSLEVDRGTPIDKNNVSKVLDLGYSNVWYAAKIEVNE